MKLRLRRQALPAPLEDWEHGILADWLWHAHVDGNRLQWLHAPSGVYLRPKQIKALQRMGGIMRGMPDFLILHRLPRYPTSRFLALELKRVKGGALSRGQKERLPLLERHCHALTYVAKGAKDGIEYCQEHGIESDLEIEWRPDAGAWMPIRKKCRYVPALGENDCPWCWYGTPPKFKMVRQA